MHRMLILCINQAFLCMKCMNSVWTFLLHTIPISLNTKSLQASSVEVHELLRKILIFLHSFHSTSTPFSPFFALFNTVQRLFNTVQRLFNTVQRLFNNVQRPSNNILPHFFHLREKHLRHPSNLRAKLPINAEGISFSRRWRWWRRWLMLFRG